MSKSLTPAQVRAFQKKIYGYFDNQGRDLPWRKNLDPYRVLVSEIMLQQTQVDRVIEKYKEFLAAFPDFAALAKAPLPKLLKIWSGMGYNRRALSLRKLAQKSLLRSTRAGCRRTRTAPRDAAGHRKVYRGRVLGLRVQQAGRLHGHEHPAGVHP